MKLPSVQTIFRPFGEYTGFRSMAEFAVSTFNPAPSLRIVAISASPLGLFSVLRRRPW